MGSPISPETAQWQTLVNNQSAITMEPSSPHHPPSDTSSNAANDTITDNLKHLASQPQVKKFLQMLMAQISADDEQSDATSVSSAAQESNITTTNVLGELSMTSANLTTSAAPTSTRTAVATAEPARPVGAANVTVNESNRSETVHSGRQGQYANPLIRYDKHIVHYAGSALQEDAILWLEHFEQAADRNEWSDAHKLKNVGAYLDANAAAWWSNERQALTAWRTGNNPAKSSVGTFYHAYLTAFVTPELQSFWQNQLLQAKQCSNEDVSKYAMRIQDLVKRVRFNNEFSDFQVSEIFLNGLTVDLQTAILDFESDKQDSSLRTFDKRVETARRYEFNRRRTGNVAAITPANTTVAPELPFDRVPRIRPLYTPSPLKSTAKSDAKTEEISDVEKQIEQLAVHMQTLVKHMASQNTEKPQYAEKPQYVARAARPCPFCNLTDNSHNWAECKRSKQQGFH
jgi:hypothetical protein